MSKIPPEKQADIGAYVRAHWAYNPTTGEVTGRGGRVIGSKKPDGLRSAMVYIPSGTTSVLLHRAAWFLMTGAWPEHQVDHRDGDRGNNKWSNLREATHSQNRQNLNPVTAKGQLRGVTKQWNRWKAQIKGADGIYHYLGMFATQEDAHAAYCRAKAIYQPFQPEQRQHVAPPARTDR